MNLDDQDKAHEPTSAGYLKKTQLVVIAMCFVFYVMAFPTLVISMKNEFSFLSNPQIRAKLFYASLYSMCGSILASLILITIPISEDKRSFGLVSFLLFSTCPLVVRFIDSNFAITHGPFTGLWIEINTLGYASMLFLTIPVSLLLSYFIRKMDLNT